MESDDDHDNEIKEQSPTDGRGVGALRGCWREVRESECKKINLRKGIEARSYRALKTKGSDTILF